MHFFNERWAADVLNMRINPKKGPDLIDDKKVMEVKFKVVYPNEYMHLSWRTLEYQMAYGKDREAYWGLGTYTLSRHISEIRRRDIKNIELMVLDREIAIVPWYWIYQFKPYRQVGQTRLSKWDNIIRFPKAKLLPRTIETYVVNGGRVNITEGVDPNSFCINGKGRK
jgi:hypothetical protein